MKRLLYILILTGLVASCGILPSSDTDKKTVITNHNRAELNLRISTEKAGVVGVVVPGTESTTSHKVVSVSDFPENDKTPTTDQALVRVASVAPPVHNGKTLTASHVYVSGDLGFIAYNRMGPEYLGAIEIVDVSDIYNPSITSQLLLTAIDISSILRIGNQLYFVGARDRDQYFNVNSPAVLGRVTLNGNQFASSVELLEIPGFVGTDLTYDGSALFISSGTNGIIAKVDLGTFSITSSVSAEDVRSVLYHDGLLAVLSGSEGAHLYNAQNLNSRQQLSNRESSPNAKRTMVYYSNYLAIAEGEAGAGIYETSTGNRVFNVPLSGDPVEGVLPEERVTNAVSVTDDVLWMANGGAGLSLARLEDGEFSVIGNALIGGSTNYVQSAGSYVFVASGSEGMQILRRELPQPEVFINCSNAVTYNGPAWLNVNSGENLVYTGSASLMGVNVNQNLTFCGSLVVSSNLNVNSNGVFSMYGSLSFGQMHQNTTLHINGTLRVQGSVVLYGNLNMNSGSRLEFLGEGSSITIYGSVTRNNNSVITGNYTDTQGKL